MSGDWGDSLVDNRDVADRVQPRVVRSLTIAGLGFALALPIALCLGVYSARRSGRRTDVTLSSSSVILASMPEFLIGLLLILLFGVTLGVLPVDSTGAGFGSFGTRAEAYVLPTLALAPGRCPTSTGWCGRTSATRSQAPYVRAADLRGVSSRSLIWNHVTPNASLPLVNAVALTLAELFGGMIIIEYGLLVPGHGAALRRGGAIRRRPRRSRRWPW